MKSLYSQEQIAALEATISRERLERYLLDCPDDIAAALERYVHNTAVSEAFYTPLQGLEVSLRNAIHTQLSNRFGAEWYNEGVANLQHPLTEMIDNAKNSLQRDKKPIEPGRVVAELNFGFWVSILGPKYDTSLWRSTLRHAFPNRSKGRERKEIQGALNAIRRLRNRVAHHEPILHRDLKADYVLILETISFICPETSAWVESQCRVSDLIQ